jgi:hypothetical protein
VTLTDIKIPNADFSNVLKGFILDYLQSLLFVEYHRDVESAQKDGNGLEGRVKDDDGSHRLSRRSSKKFTMEDISINFVSSLFPTLLPAGKILEKIIRIDNFQNFSNIRQ